MSYKNKIERALKGLKESLKKFLQEILPSGDKVLHENHDKEKRNTNSGLKTNHITKIDVRNFDGKDLVRWILQMEQLFC